MEPTISQEIDHETKIDEWEERNFVEIKDHVELKLATKMFLELTSQMKLAEQQAKELKKRLTKYQFGIDEHLQEMDATSTPVYEFGAVKISGLDYKPTIAQENKEKLFDWVKERGDGDIIKTDIHYQTLKSYVKELVEQDVEMPEFLKYNVYNKLKAMPTKKKDAGTNSRFNNV